MEKQNRKPDRRVIKTKKAIRNAFAKLLSEKEIDTITIKEISIEADINRKTFYNYYNNIAQLIEEVENDIATSFASAMSDISFSQFMLESKIAIDRATEVFKKDLDFYSCLMKSGVNTSLYNKLVEKIIERTSNSVKIPEDFNENSIKIVIRYSISGMISVYQDWVNSDRSMPLEDISNVINKLFQYGLETALK